jgi:uncharacterized Fe-S cluster protein YjdI/CDGSH-type Zn-finger protein
MENITKKYTNGEVTVVWKPGLCIHAAICFTELPQVFDPLSRPWINPNAASTDQIIEVVDKCPTQALAWYMNKQEEAKEKPVESKEHMKITVLENGPYLINGDFKIYDAKGNEIVTEGTAALCRCSHSKIKPLCDGAHKEAGFKDHEGSEERF